MVDPSFATLLADATGDASADLGPLDLSALRSMLRDKPAKQLVLLGGPCAFEQSRSKHLGPPVQTLDGAALVAEGTQGDGLPVVTGKLSHGFAEGFILRRQSNTQRSKQSQRL